MENVKYIPLKNGGAAIVDVDDYEFLSQWKWKRHKQGYACRTGWANGKWTCILMHRLVNKTPDGLETDHINGNKMDNRKANLRAVTHSINERNKGLSKSNKSGVKGVFWDKSRGKWCAKTKHMGRFYNIGRFDDINEAVEAYKKCVSELTR